MMKLNVFLLAAALALDVRSGKFLAQEASLATSTSDVPPISTTMQCIINLTVQYFLVYTALAVVRTMNDLSAPVNGKKPYAFAQSVMHAASLTVNYAPMLSVLFLGTRMRALQLSGGDPDKYDLPQPWVKMAMQFCAWSVVVQTLMVLIVPLVLGGEPKVEEDGTPVIEGGSTTAAALTFVRYASMAAMYGGFSTVCAGAIFMEAPADGPFAGKAPPVSPAVACTMNLTVQYFAVYLAVALMQTYHQFQAKTPLTTKLTSVLQLATNTVNFAPMLCILFIGARMRALQIDPVNGNPQKWAQTCFYVCAYSVLVQLLLVLVVPLLLDGEPVPGDTEGDVTFEFKNSPTLYGVCTAIRYCAMLMLYAGFTIVIYSVCVIKNPNGPTPPVSPTMQCVMNLTIQFFFVYLMLWVLITVKDFAGASNFLDVAIPTFDSARATVQFAPMLSVLFVGTRMRALQITDQKGAPQGWVQQCMFLSTYAVLLQVLMVLLLPLFTGGAPKTDADGNVVEDSSGGVLAKVTVGVRYTAFVLLYGGVVAVICGLMLITPETATGRGSLIPGVDVPPPPAVPA